MPPLQVTYDTITEHGCVQYALARIGTFTIGWYADRYACDDETSALHIRYGAATGAAGEFEPRGGWPDPPRIFRQQLYGASVVDVHDVLAHHPGSTASWIRVRRRTDHGISLALDGTTRRVADGEIAVGENAPARIAAPVQWGNYRLDVTSDGVQVHGHVPDLRPWLDGCVAAVAPLRYGAGVKGKVNEAMAHGLPVVGTPAAVEGMHLVDGHDVLVGADAEAFAAAIARLHGDADLWTRLARHGRDNVARHFSLDAARDVVRETFLAR